MTCNVPIQVPDFKGIASSNAPNRRSRPMAWVLASLVAIAFATAAIVVVVRQGGQTLAQMQTNRMQVSSMRNAEKIALALNAYARDHGRYPPPFTTDPSGKALHSWRVLLLPYLGEETLYNEIRLDLPWDHTLNQTAVMGTMPDVYRHPSMAPSGYNEVSGYYLITGKGTLFPPEGPMGPNDVRDNPSQTVLLVEGTPKIGSDTWTEPVDLDFQQMRGDLAAAGGFEPGGVLGGGAVLVTVDGRGHFLSDTTPPLVFRSLVTPSGNETLPDDTLD